MAKLTQAMKDMLTNNLAYIATVDDDGNPDIGPKMSLRVLDDSHLIYNEMTAKQTMRNIATNGKAIVAAASLDNMKGFRFAGTAKLYTTGPYFDNAMEWAKVGHPAPKSAGVITIDRIYTLDAGPLAGELVQE
ncbi:pyridoxamine 5'-phosphate oxidase family protein [Loigolactobacillus backii]|uniref:Pyridoxamine 5'-phosphate oxidase n=1 Tax=Loigolactobacillus backii TaxID=375175 RepID=A0A192H121_9LACO|nr:pyridoxamine 5'-phosphate oxidase family protein [Loigolactobacillus backii]ANK60447.1 pyridoxamine 5'-phosphate oxidase [Loigolactobacillus backii]ANK62055.1 pyridoxamine 5'-phosphate oxidase [Loigolactobacillus backii]ANK65326.1 pyridoxamine 5'-phosphate oxidase [Loigolactobacillus backii]ANK67877.1 pyridoxamine 5'-phosphate oxidase [Loigolactobacillus backii]ANK68751.1 pyridoxamine 5'-phosphate oxidase [Loigolactobacillus backii]